jgi:hypothetical protein
MHDSQVTVRRDDVYATVLQRQVIGRGLHRNSCVPREQLGQDALMLRSEVLDYDEGDILDRKIFDELNKSFKPTCGGANSYD